MKRLLISLLVIAAFCIYVPVSSTLQIYRTNIDCKPALATGSIVFVSKYKKVEVGRLACYRTANGEVKIQRVVALEGDTVEFNDGVLLRNKFVAENAGAILFKYNIKRYYFLEEPILKKCLEGLQGDTVVLSLTYYQRDTLSRHFRVRRYGSIFKRNIAPIIVPQGKCFVLADNRDASIDSRHFGCISVDRIIGCVINQ